MGRNDSAFRHPMQHTTEMQQRQPIRIVRGDGCHVFDVVP